MEDHNHHDYSLRDLLPIASVFGLVLGVTASSTYLFQLELMRSMTLFMGLFFLILGGLKAYNLEGFVNAYRSYDLLAAKSRSYSYIYPFIEIGFAASYLGSSIGVSTASLLLATNAAVAFFMLVGAAGVAKELGNDEKIPCACLGEVFHVPMTWVTLFEDLLMAGMALLMLVLTI